MPKRRPNQHLVYNRIWQPRCFELDEWNNWLSAELAVPRRTGKNPITSICVDCTREYQVLMIKEEKCGNSKSKRP